LLVTIRLVGSATLAALTLGLLSGSVAAVRKGSRLDRATTVACALGLAVPTFWLASLLKEGGVWINERIGHRVFFTVGATSSGYEGLSLPGRVGDLAGHLLLPSVALVVGMHAVLSRYHRTAMVEELASDHVRLARAKGLTPGAVLRRHVLRNALIPVTTVAALLVAGLLTGSVIIEQTFRWRGMGTFLLDSVAAADQFAVLAYLAVATVLVVGAGLVADLAYAVLDPRVRRG
jgi:peptide/nickel transport system permease protein